MKIDAIKKCIEMGRVTGLPIPHRGALEELAALEADNAAKDKALAKIKEYAGDVSEYMDEIVLKSTASYGDPSSLTPDSRKVLVDVEKLSLIRRIVSMQESLLSYWHHRGDTTCEESVADAYRDVRSDAVLLLGWLAALLKDRP